MSTYTRRRLSPQRQHNIRGPRQSNDTQAQHGVAPMRRVDRVDCPFPNKPVIHRRIFNHRAQYSPDLYDLEKMTITKQPRGYFLPQGPHLDGTRETAGSQHRRKDLHRLCSGELQIVQAIHAKELKLQEKLCRVEDKIRQKIRRDTVEAAAGNDEMKREERGGRGQPERGEARTKPGPSELHRREAVRSRELLIQEIRQEDVKQLGKRLNQWDEDRMRDTHEEDEARWNRSEREYAGLPQSKGNLIKGTHKITVGKQRVSGELNTSRWENVKEHARRKGYERDHRVWGEAALRPQDGIEKGKEREQYKTSIDVTKEKKHMERTCKDMYDAQDIPQISQHKTTDRLATENHGGAERKTQRESSLPPISSPSHSGGVQKEQLGLEDIADASLQLLPCRICNRRFASERLEKHMQVCQKLEQKQRQVFNSYANRTKGSAMEEFLKTHSRSKTPEVSELHFYLHKDNQVPSSCIIFCFFLSPHF